VQIPLGTYAYRRGDGLVPSIRLENLYYEESPSNLKDGVALLTRPTLTEFAAADAGGGRAVFWESDVFADDIVAVIGTKLFRVTSAGVKTEVGSIPNPNPGANSDADLVDIAASPTKILIANGDLLESDGATVTSVTFPDDQGVISVGYIDGYFLAVPLNSHRIYYTDLVTGLFAGDRFISAERYPDDILRIVVTSDEIWAMGRESVEVFVRTGVDTATQPPFQRVLNGWTVVEADNSVYWAGTSKDSGPGVYRGDATPKDVSTPAIAERLGKADPLKLKAWTFGMHSHSFYVLEMGDQGTAALDISTGRWTDFASYGREKWRAHTGRGCGSLVIACDDETGQLWKLEDGTTDDGEPVVQVFTAGAPVAGRMPNASVALECAVGQADGPKISLRHSDDQGRTWIDEGLKSLGALGDYSARVRWTRLGQMKPPVRVFEWTVSEPVRLRVSAALLNEVF
jgi:hypothetical protein